MSKSKIYIVLIVVYQFINPCVEAQFDGGDGTLSNPWQITSLEQLNRVRNHLSGNFILTSDLNFNGSEYDSINSVNGWESIGSEEEPFRGVFKGNGHLINNMYLRNHNSYIHGLFGYVKNAIIDSLALVNYTVLVTSEVGGLVGVAESSDISHCYATGYIDGHNDIGGLVGKSIKSNLSCCYFNGEVIGNENVGGLIGYAENSELTQNYAVCCILESQSSGLLLGVGFGNYLDACYYCHSLEGRGWGVGDFYGYSSDYELGDYEISSLSMDGMRDDRSFNGFDFENDWDIIDYKSFPALRGMDNVPIAVADTISSMDNLLKNAYDYETGRDNLIWKLDSIVPLSSGELFTDTMSLSKYDDWYVYYKVGEIRTLENDTLWSGISVSYLDLYMNNMINREEVIVYPNPCTTKYLYLQYNQTLEVESTSLYDLTGKCVFFEEAGVDQIYMRNYLSGFYILKLQTKEGTIIRKVLRKG